MNGGNDGLNTVIPLDQMDGITSVRSNIYLPENKVIDLQNHDLGLHTAMTGFKDLFDESRLKIVQNVGYPNPDFSHLDQWIFGSLHRTQMSILPQVGWVDIQKNAIRNIRAISQRSVSASALY